MVPVLALVVDDVLDVVRAEGVELVLDDVTDVAEVEVEIFVWLVVVSPVVVIFAESVDLEILVELLVVTTSAVVITEVLEIPVEVTELPVELEESVSMGSEAEANVAISPVSEAVPNGDRVDSGDVSVVAEVFRKVSSCWSSLVTEGCWWYLKAGVSSGDIELRSIVLDSAVMKMKVIVIIYNTYIKARFTK